MNLWGNGSGGSAGYALKATVEGIVGDVNREVVSRGVRLVNALRNAELEVLKGQRSGKKYKKPFSSTMYTASAPGEPPARRTGALRVQWTGNVETKRAGAKEMSVRAYIESGTPYAAYLEHGTGRMAPRPYVDRIVEKAMPEVTRIMGESYGR